MLSYIMDTNSNPPPTDLLPPTSAAAARLAVGMGTLGDYVEWHPFLTIVQELAKVDKQEMEAILENHPPPMRSANPHRVRKQRMKLMGEHLDLRMEFKYKGGGKIKRRKTRKTKRNISKRKRKTRKRK